MRKFNKKIRTMVLLTILLSSSIYSMFFSETARIKALMKVCDQSVGIVSTNTEITEKIEMGYSILVIGTKGERAKLKETAYLAQVVDENGLETAQLKVYKLDDLWVYKWRGLYFRFMK